MKVVVYHEEYGCDTGCCGHAIYVDNDYGGWRFGHPWDEDKLEWTKDFIRSELGEDHVKDLDWENCIVVSD